jgi:hypothetical protein
VIDEPTRRLDEGALRALVPRVLAGLVRRGEDFDAAEDALQEALLEALRVWPEHPPRDPRAWLATVATRRLVDARRSEAARHRREETTYAEARPAATTTSYSPPRPALWSRMLTGCGSPWLPILPGSRAPPATMPTPICAAISPGVPTAAWIRSWPGARTWSCIRWMQEVRLFRPSTVSRRFSVTAGFYRTCVIDGVLENSPAEYVRRPAVPAESPTLGFTHLQFEALLSAARRSANRNDFALVAMLGLLGLRIFEATGADIGDLGEEHGHRVLRVCGKGGKVVLVPLPSGGRPGHRPRRGSPWLRAGPAQQPRPADGPACSHAAAPAARRGSGSPDRPASSPYAPAHVCYL